MAQPQLCWGKERAGSKASPHSDLATPSSGGGRGRGSPNTRPLPPTSCWPQLPPSSLLAPEVQRVTLTSPGSHTHTRCGGFWFLFFKKHVYKKKKDISETEGGGEETSLMSGLAGVGGGGVGGQTMGRGWAAEKREGQRARLRPEVLTVHVSLMFVLDEGVASGLS